MSAFTGVRVLDFSANFAPAMAAMHLGDFGAEVIKIDPTLEERKRMGLLVMLYLIITAVLFGFAKRRVWREAH